MKSKGDRIRATKMATFAIQFLETTFEELKETNNKGEKETEEKGPKKEARSCVVGEVGGETITTSLEEIESMCDFAKRRPKEQWWLHLWDTFQLLSWPTPAALGQQQ